MLHPEDKKVLQNSDLFEKGKQLEIHDQSYKNKNSGIIDFLRVALRKLVMKQAVDNHPRQ